MADEGGGSTTGGTECPLAPPLLCSGLDLIMDGSRPEDTDPMRGEAMARVGDASKSPPMEDPDLAR